MTLLKQDDGGYWISGPLAGVVLTAIFAFFTVIYQFQNDKLWEDGSEISELKTTAVNLNSQITRMEVTLGQQNTTLITILNSVQAVKDSNDALKSQVDDLRKQVAGLDLMLRPIPSGR